MVAYLRGVYNTQAVNQAIEGGLGSAIRRECITDIASFWHSVCVLVMLAQSFWPVCLVEGESMRRTYEVMHSTEYISKGFYTLNG